MSPSSTCACWLFVIDSSRSAPPLSSLLAGESAGAPRDDDSSALASAFGAGAGRARAGAAVAAAPAAGADIGGGGAALAGFGIDGCAGAFFGPDVVVPCVLPVGAPASPSPGI